MADNDATLKLSFDATSAKQGAFDFVAAGNQIIAANQAVVASETKAADAINAAATRSTGARRSAAQAAKDATAVQAAAAAAGGDAVTAQTDRIVTSTSKQKAAIDRIAASFDPMLAAASRAQRQLDTLVDISAQGGPQGARADVLMQQGVDRLNAAQANQAFANAAGTGVAQPPGPPLNVTGVGSAAAGIAPISAAATEAGTSIDLLNARMAGLRATLNDGIGNVGQYAGAWDRVSGSMDAYIAAATRANAVTAEQIVQARMAQNALNSQQNINQLTGVQTSPGSIGGVPFSASKSAAESAAVFQAAGFTGDPDAERAKVDSLFAVSKQYEAQYNTIANLRKTGIYNEAQEGAAIDRLNVSYKAQQDGMNRAGVAAGHLSLANAGVTRELIVMGHEVLMGNWSRLGGSMLVIAERVGGLGEILKSVGGFLKSPLGIGTVVGVAAVAGITALAVAAEDAALRVERLQNALALVRPDFAAASQAAEQAAKALAQTTFLSTADARTGTQAVYSNPAFQGTTQQAGQIASTFATLSRALGETSVDWKRLNDAMNDPAATLQTLLDQDHLVGVNQALVDHVKLMQQAGDKAGAFGAIMKVVQGATAGTMTRMTPLETALHDLSLAFVKTGQDGHSFAENLGTPITATIALVIESLAKLVTELRSLGEQYPKTMSLIAAAIKSFPGAGLLYGNALGGAITTPGGAPGALPPGMVPTTSYGGVSGGVSTTAAPGSAVPGAVTGTATSGMPLTGNISTTALNQIYSVAEQAAIQPLVADFATRLAEVESQGRQFNPQGGVLTSSAGALGMMQVMPDSAFGDHTGSATQRTVAGHSFDLTQTDTNIAASLAIITQLWSQFNGDLPKIAVGYNAGPGVASGAVRQNPRAYDETTGYLRKLGLPDPRGGVATAVAASGTASAGTAGVINPEGGPTNFGASGTGMTNKTLIDDAQKAADSMGLTATAASKADAEVTRFKLALKADPGNVLFQQALQKANLELYNAVPAATAALRAIDLQTGAEDRIAAAWVKGATAAAEVSNQIKAETQATQFAKPGTDEWNAAVVVLTGALNRQAAAAQGAQQAQQALIDDNIIAYTQKEIDTLGMEAGARTAVLSALKAQQDAEIKYANNPVAQQASEANAAAISKLNFTLQQNDAALSAVASGFSSSFDTIGNAMTQSFLSGQGAAVNWANVMTSAAQQVLQQFMKLAVINPLLNSLGLGGPNGLPTLDTVGQAINQQAANGTGIGGMLNGTFLGNLFGVTGAAGGTTSPGSLNANDLAFASGSAAADLSQIPVPPIPVAHTGWAVGMPPPASRYVHPAYFDDAPRFHTGMTPQLAADEFPAILQRGERVITAKQDSRVLDVISKLAMHAQSAHGLPTAPPPTGQRDPFLPTLAHAEAVAKALPHNKIAGVHVFHSGGIVGETAPVAAALRANFAHAPRLHDGGPIGAATGSGGQGFGSGAPGASMAFLQGIAGTNPLANAISNIPGFAAFSGASAASGPAASSPVASDVTGVSDLSGPSGGVASSDTSFFDEFLNKKSTATHILHIGGIVGASSASAAYPTALFANAPRFHDGSDPNNPFDAVTTGNDTQFSGLPAVSSAYDKIKALLGPNIVALPSGGFAIAGAPGGYPGNTTTGSILPTLAGLALPAAMLALKAGSLFSGNGLLSANTLNANFGTTFGAGTFPSAANPYAIPAGYASDTFTPLPGAVAGVAPDVAASTAADVGTEAAASSGGWLDAISALFAHQGGVVGSGDIPTRQLALSGFSVLPRFHDGLGADEFLTMLQPGHRVVTAAHQASMMHAADQVGAAPAMAAILHAGTAVGSPHGAFPAILQHGEKTLGKAQQQAILTLMSHGGASAGHRDPIPRFHAGYGGQDFLDLITQGDRAMNDRQQGATKATAATDQGGAHFHGDIIINAPKGSTRADLDSFKRAMPQMLRDGLNAQVRATSRNS